MFMINMEKGGIELQMQEALSEQIQKLIADGRYEDAIEYMDAWKAESVVYTNTMAILEAGIYEGLGDRQKVFTAIRDGLIFSHDNYELYYMLAYYYLAENLNQAYLCMQNALYYCDNEADAATIAADMQELEHTGQLTVVPTAIVIVSYNSCYLMQKNIESIRNTVPRGTYRMIVVDNASTDGVRQWLAEQEDVLLVCNEENRGFPGACNQGADVRAEFDGQEYDVFLLNNDTRLADNALFWLKMGLYESETVGATGSVSNYAGNEQQIDIEFTMPAEYLEFGGAINVPERESYEERVRLSGFAMLIKGKVWNLVGGMDENFSPGYFEDDDLSMRILREGYRLFVCKNSFIYHAGSQSFAGRNDINELLLSHHSLFVQKYGFDILQYAYPNMDTIMQIPFSREQEFNLLQVGSGLGADLKCIRRMFPNANVIGVEPGEALYFLSKETDVVFPDMKSLTEVFAKPVFQVLLIEEQMRKRLGEAERKDLLKLCCDTCIVLPKKVEKAEKSTIPFEQVKLVIWDMDQTFWRGIISEGQIALPEENIWLIQALTDCGVINSISSKNDANQVMAVLQERGIAEYFVFADINWQNKGEQISKKLMDMHLRPENVLFVDDDIRNLEEALYYNPGLMTAKPDVIPELMTYVKKQNKTDIGHKRLAQYKLLEQKRKIESTFSSKEQFLQYSNIVMEICEDCLPEIDRIAELVARTNQLNFTKNRDSKEELQLLLQNDNVKKGYIRVRDIYGDYGITGFYAYEQDNVEMRHFLFSCRVMGMGIAERLYHFLGTPKIRVTEPVVIKLEEAADAPWVNCVWVHPTQDLENPTQKQGSNAIKVLMKGPCDMSVIGSYLSGGELTTEFNFVNAKGFITTGQNHSMHIWQSAVLENTRLEKIIAEVPFITMDDFTSSIFEKEYHVICYSLLPDCHAGLYRNKQSGEYISFGSRNFDLTNPQNWQGYVDGSIVNHAFPFSRDILEKFSKNWEFVGSTSGEDLIRNLEYMYSHCLGEPMFILLLGSEMEYEGENAEFANHAQIHKKMNDLVKRFAADKERVRLIEMTRFIHTQEDYEDCINHFSRNVYYDLATAVCSCINEKVDSLKKKM